MCCVSAIMWHLNQINAFFGHCWFPGECSYGYSYPHIILSKTGIKCNNCHVSRKCIRGEVRGRRRAGGGRRPGGGGGSQGEGEEFRGEERRPGGGGGSQEGGEEARGRESGPGGVRGGQGEGEEARGRERRPGGGRGGQGEGVVDITMDMNLVTCKSLYTQGHTHTKPVSILDQIF